MSIVTIDSYINGASTATMYAGAMIAYGQSFTNANDITLDSCAFYLRKYGSPTGSCYAKIYAHSGTFGSSSIPSGSALATSEAFDVSTLTTSFQWITFSFSGANRISLSSSTYYVIIVTFNGGGLSNFVTAARS